jgi:hypothetical protein
MATVAPSPGSLPNSTKCQRVDATVGRLIPPDRLWASRASTLDAYRAILITHLFGLAFGLGGAAMLDTIMLIACRRSRVSRDLIALLHTASAMVAAAMTLLVISGIGFFLAGAEATPKFWAKMVIVLIACGNGLVVHQLIFPWLETGTASGNGTPELPVHRARIAAASAAISSVSWSAALILGASRGQAMGIIPILGIYFVALFGALLVSTMLIAPRVFTLQKRERIPFRTGMKERSAAISYRARCTLASVQTALDRFRATRRTALTQRDIPSS